MTKQQVITSWSSRSVMRGRLSCSSSSKTSRLLSIPPPLPPSYRGCKSRSAVSNEAKKTLRIVASWTLLLFWFDLAKQRADDANSKKLDFYKLLKTGQLLTREDVIRETQMQPHIVERVLRVQSKILTLIKSRDISV